MEMKREMTDERRHERDKNVVRQKEKQKPREASRSLLLYFTFLRPRKVIFLGATRSGRKTVARPENRWKGLFDVGRTIEAPFRYLYLF